MQSKIFSTSEWTHGFVSQHYTRSVEHWAKPPCFFFRAAIAGGTMERPLGSSIRLKDYTVDRYMASKLHRILGYVWPERMMTTWIVWISSRNKDNGWIFSERCRSELQQVINCGIKSTEREICLWNFIRALGILDLHMDYEFMLMMTWIDWIRISDRSIELHRPIQHKSLSW